LIFNGNKNLTTSDPTEREERSKMHGPEKIKGIKNE